MLNNEIMDALLKLQPNKKDIYSLESVSLNRCDCTNGCTDNCYDCSSNSGNQW